jgi:transglutaminase-like putative cysteine protease
MMYHVRHVTSVKYDAIVWLARFNLRLMPAAWAAQTTRNFRLNITPSPAETIDHAGPFVVNVARMTIAEPLIELIIDSSFDVDVAPVTPAFEALSPTIAQVRQAALDIRSVSNLAPSAYLFGSRMTQAEEAIALWASDILRPEMTITEAALALTQCIRRDFAYDPKATDNNTPAGTAFALRRGVCQDFAHIMIIALRSQGLPAAYVSGYLRTLPPPGKPKLVGADATHAWVNLWCGAQLGWLGFDPTNGCMTGTDHIFTAMGRDYADVAPVDGVLLGGAGQHLRVAVDVTETVST